MPDPLRPSLAGEAVAALKALGLDPPLGFELL
jgi:hypothetical protein